MVTVRCQLTLSLFLVLLLLRSTSPIAHRDIYLVIISFFIYIACGTGMLIGQNSTSPRRAEHAQLSPLCLLLNEEELNPGCLRSRKPGRLLLCDELGIYRIILITPSFPWGGYGLLSGVGERGGMCNHGTR
ncbi:hypothetical protein F4778DRAFT_423997 [Xylariomycetidae sp. FL2044]|nr:hypothetical protein F4778DRAFT_423997 [Xylariomycetidae sp. FL2044]